MKYYGRARTIAIVDNFYAPIDKVKDYSKISFKVKALLSETRLYTNVNV